MRRDVEVAMLLQRTRARVAERYGMTIAETRAMVLEREAADREGSVTQRPMLPTVHSWRGGRSCPGC